MYMQLGNFRDKKDKDEDEIHSGYKKSGDIAKKIHNEHEKNENEDTLEDNQDR